MNDQQPSEYILQRPGPPIIRRSLLFSLIIGAAAPDDQPKMFKAIERFRAIVDEPFLDRVTVRRGGLVVILEFAFRTRKIAVAYFSRRKRSASRAPRKKAGKGKSPADAGVEDIIGRLATASLRDVEGNRLCRRRYSCVPSCRRL
jgi:hypothetical protein